MARYVVNDKTQTVRDAEHPDERCKPGRLHARARGRCSKRCATLSTTKARALSPRGCV